MTRKVYRSAQGKMVDLGSMHLRNEMVRAVGNMGVNARGDLIDSQNRPIDTRNQQVARQYNRQTNVQDTEVKTSAKTIVSRTLKVPEPPEDFDDNFDKDSLGGTTEPPVVSPPFQPKTTPIMANKVPLPTNEEVPAAGGLAEAIARARKVTQELDTPVNPTNNNTDPTTQSRIRKI